VPELGNLFPKLLKLGKNIDCVINWNIYLNNTDIFLTLFVLKIPRTIFHPMLKFFGLLL